MVQNLRRHVQRNVKCGHIVNIVQVVALNNFSMHI